jgi:hypothetical protein
MLSILLKLRVRLRLSLRLKVGLGLMPKTPTLNPNLLECQFSFFRTDTVGPFPLARFGGGDSMFDDITKNIKH